MKKLSMVTLAILATIFFVSLGQAQGTLEALSLTIIGDGSVTPLQDGELLEVGQSYEMDAIPDTGYVFTGWQQVNVSTFYQNTINAQGQPVPLTNTIITSPVLGIYSGQTNLDFTMQSVTVILNVPVEEITESSGWQADFAAVPEPSSGVLVISGLMMLGLHGKWRSRYQWLRPFRK